MSRDEISKEIDSIVLTPFEWRAEEYFSVREKLIGLIERERAQAAVVALKKVRDAHKNTKFFNGVDWDKEVLSNMIGEIDHLLTQYQEGEKHDS